MGITVLFGGTFNPPHIAHRKMLEAVSKIDNIDKIFVVPTNIPPHKEVDGFCAPVEDRLNMCRLLSDGIDKAFVSDMEIKRGGKSYTYDTLTNLLKSYENIYLLVGGDMITSFDTWYRFKDILKLCGIFAVRRVGIDDNKFDNAVENLRQLGGYITVVDAELPEISSTEIRNTLGNNKKKELQKVLPHNICDYIVKRKLYR